MGKRRRVTRILLLFGLLAAGLAAAVLLYPFWLPYAAGPVAERFGARFSSFTRLEGGRFALQDLVYTNRSVTVTASKVEGFLPHIWYRQRGVTNSEKPFVEVNGWKVLVEPRARTNAPAATNRSVFAHYQKFEQWLAKGREWLPKATLLNGTVIVKGREFTFPLITLENGQLNADGVWPENAIPIEIKGKLAEEPYQISYAMHPLDLRFRLQMFETNGAAAAKLAAFYKENRLDALAEFGPESGMLPRTANARAREVKLPAELLKLNGYSDVSGSLAAEWKSNSYTAKVEAHAEPLASAAGRPPVDVKLSASGDTNRARVDALQATLPGLNLKLSEPVEVSYAGKMLSGQSELAIDADLAKLPWGNLEGQMNATVLLKPGEKIPVFWVRARATNVNAFHFRAATVKLSAKLDWPRLEELAADAILGTNASVTLTGAADFQSRTLTNVQISAEGTLGTNALPKGIEFEEVKLQASASGSISNLQHAGGFELRRFRAPGLEPLTLEAQWSATLFAFEQLVMRARAGPAVLRARGEGYISGEATNFTFRELSLAKGDEEYLTLAKPFDVRLTAGPRIEADELLMRGMDRELRLAGDLRWPAHGKLELGAVNVSPELLQSFVTRSLRGLQVPEFQAHLSWSNGPVAGFVSGVAELEEKRFGALRGVINSRFDENGLVLTNLSVADAAGEVVKAEGFLPVSIEPAGEPKLNVSRREEMDFRLQTAPSEHFWSVVSELSKLQLSNPAVRVELRGTVRRPVGELEARAGYAALARTNRELPAAGPVAAKISLSEQRLRIAEFRASVEGQPVTASGEIPLGTNFWTQRREEIVGYLLDHANFSLQAREVQLAPFARFAPRYLSPQGTAELDLHLRPNRKLEGTAAVRGVETRPLPKIGVIQGIETDLRLNGTEVEVLNLSGVIGGQRLAITGRLDTAEEHLAKGYPLVDLAIRGENVPLARNPDVILRSDLNLTVRNGTNMVPVIAGDVMLQDSFLLRDIATLVPGRVAGPERRPPYFNIPQEPVDDWTLDVRVRGQNFMRIRSPFFQGVASANFHVTGRLEEPVALGEAAVGSGRIIFPFASLEVKQALVSLTSENPYLPRVFVTATGRAFGFDVRMQVEGLADEPVIEFSSVPALTSEQIILMLTTGQIPREDFGFSQEDRAGKLALFLGKSLWEKLNPGKAGEERLFIRSGQDITEQGRQTYEVEYKLSDRWSLVGEYDRFGALNANVKWRLFSR